MWRVFSQGLETQTFTWRDSHSNFGSCLFEHFQVNRDDLLSELPLGALHQFIGNLTALLQCLEAFHLDRREVRENIHSATFGFDESEPFGVVEPLDSAFGHDAWPPQRKCAE